MTERTPARGASPAGPDANDEAVVTRSEERLSIITHRRETRRARLTKFAETETVTQTLPVRRERVRIEYEEIADDAGQAPRGEASTANGEGWLVLYDEEVVVQTRWVPRERVRLAVHSVTEEREISEELRSERIAVDSADRGPSPERTPRPG